MSLDIATATVKAAIISGDPTRWQTLVAESGCGLWELLDAWHKLCVTDCIPLDRMFVIDWYSARDEVEPDRRRTLSRWDIYEGRRQSRRYTKAEVWGQAKSHEQPRKQERAKGIEKPKTRERAIGSEEPTEIERAKNREKPTGEERAIISEEPISIER